MMRQGFASLLILILGPSTSLTFLKGFSFAEMNRGPCRSFLLLEQDVAGPATLQLRCRYPCGFSSSFSGQSIMLVS